MTKCVVLSLEYVKIARILSTVMLPFGISQSVPSYSFIKCRSEHSEWRHFLTLKMYGIPMGERLEIGILGVLSQSLMQST